jgi:hypothetical protein
MYVKMTDTVVPPYHATHEYLWKKGAFRDSAYYDIKNSRGTLLHKKIQLAKVGYSNIEDIL